MSPLASASAPKLADRPVTVQGTVREAPSAAQDRAGRRLGGWRAVAVLMMLVVLAMAGLPAAWRFAPEYVPPLLRPVRLMRLLGVKLPEPPPPRMPAPPESQFDE